MTDKSIMSDSVKHQLVMDYVQFINHMSLCKATKLILHSSQFTHFLRYWHENDLIAGTYHQVTRLFRERAALDDENCSLDWKGHQHMYLWLNNFVLVLLFRHIKCAKQPWPKGCSDRV